MEPVAVVVPSFVATTLGFLVFLTGAAATRKVRILRDFNIPEPVSGGLIAAAITLGIFLFFLAFVRLAAVVQPPRRKRLILPRSYLLLPTFFFIS